MFSFHFVGVVSGLCTPCLSYRCPPVWLLNQAWCTAPAIFTSSSVYKSLVSLILVPDCGIPMCYSFQYFCSCVPLLCMTWIVNWIFEILSQPVKSTTLLRPQSENLNEFCLFFESLFAKIYDLLFCDLDFHLAFENLFANQRPLCSGNKLFLNNQLQVCVLLWSPSLCQTWHVITGLKFLTPYQRCFVCTWTHFHW